MKGGGAVQAGLHQRNEWETPVSAEQLDWLHLNPRKRLCWKKICAYSCSPFSLPIFHAVFIM